jgi:hypothetical protein
MAVASPRPWSVLCDLRVENVSTDRPPYWLLQFFDPDVLPGDIVRARSRFDAVNLKSDEPFRVSLEDFLVGQVCDCFAVDPRLDVWAFGDNAELVPLAIFHDLVRLQVVFCR